MWPALADGRQGDGTADGVVGVVEAVAVGVNLVDGVVILEKNQPRPSLSSVPVRLEQTLEQSDRIGNVVPWIWTIPGSVNNEPLIRRDLMMPELLGGVDVDDLQHQQHPHLYQRTLVSGRFLTTGDQRKIVISELLSDRHDVQVGEDLPIDGTSYEVIGLYNTGNQIMNMAIVLPMSEARSKRNLSDDHVSDLYVEPVEGMSREELIDQIESVLLADDKRALEKWDVRSRTEWEGDFSDMMNEVDTLLFLISSLAVIVGTVGIINTMLMSITERTSEFGILIANGWSRSNIVQLVLLESTILGIISGVTGIGIGWVAVKVVDRMLDLTIQSATPLSLLSYCFLVAVFIGILGGVYPAYRAAKKHPIDAIRSVR